MDRSGTVSVVIPTYNRCETLPEAIDSVLAQQDVQVEVLVCDDGSTDASESVVRALDDSRVRWLPGPPSGGPSTPRNRGVAAASGTWTAFLDSDDVWRPDKLSAQLHAMAEAGVSACTTNAERWTPDHGSPGPDLLTDLPAVLDVRTLLERNVVVTSSVVASTVLVRAAGPFPAAGGRTVFEDYAVWLRLANLAPVVVLDEPLVRYRDAGLDHYRDEVAPDLVCMWNTLRDFARWRAGQQPPAEWSWSERSTAARHLLRLVAVRDLVRARPAARLSSAA